MSDAEAALREGGEFAADLHSLGVVLGIALTVDEHDEWWVDERGGVHVGLAWYLQRGHGRREAVALAALQLWEGPRDAVRAPELVLRSRALERARPELAPLIGAVRRAQAMGELLAVMPGLRAHLYAAVLRSLPSDLSVLPRHLQWASLVLQTALPQSVAGAVEDASVAGEWHAMLEIGAGEMHPLMRVLAPNRNIAPLRRFERALALLLPAYERLLAQDIAEREPTMHATVLGGSDRADLSLRSEDQLGSDDFAPEISDDGQREDTDSNDRDGDPDGADDTRTTGAPDPEHLFASAHDEFAQTVLSTPIADASSLFDATRAGDELRDDGQLEPSDAGGRGSGAAAADAVLTDYRASAERLAGAIDAVRALWASILSERVAPRRAQSRRALPEGDELAPEQFAHVVAETLAGVTGPAAFRRRIARPRLTRSAGSTDYVLMVDRSASMIGASSDAAADAALVMVEALAAAERDIAHAERGAGIDLELDIRSCLIVFAADATVIKPLSHGLDDAARRSLYAEVRMPSGSTNDAAALRAAAEQLGIGGAPAAAEVDGLRRRRVAILVGDGGTNDALAAERELHALRAAGVSVHAVGVGTDDLAVRYAPQGVSIADARQLPAALARIIEHELFD